MHQINLTSGGDTAAGSDCSLDHALNQYRAEIKAALRSSGAVLLRDTGITCGAGFETAGAQLVDRWMPYQDRASKRTAVQGAVMTSTDTPPGFTIPAHCESAFTQRWPAHILFCCTRPAEQGGATPIADTRQILTSLPANLVEKFRRCGVMYVRNFSAGVGMDWRDVFQVDSRAELEAYCAGAAISLEWLADDAVRTIQVRPALIQHPATGEEVWFNHALALSQYSLEPTLRSHLLRQVGEEGLPHNTYFGDGSTISHEQFEQIHAAHEANTLRFDWQQGDVLVLDNMLCTHGRDPYSGDRLVLAALADPLEWSDVGLQVGLPECRPQTQAAAVCASAGQSDNKDGQGIDLEVLLAWVKQQYVEVFDLEPDLSCGFVDIGGDSVMAVELLDEANDEFSLDYSLDDFLDCDNVEDFFSQLLAQPS